eukprot:3346007-Ditylum_brightwellii.AAC.1
MHARSTAQLHSVKQLQSNKWRCQNKIKEERRRDSKAFKMHHPPRMKPPLKVKRLRTMGIYAHFSREKQAWMTSWIKEQGKGIYCNKHNNKTREENYTNNHKIPCNGCIRWSICNDSCSQNS